MTRRPPRFTLFPNTTLFHSRAALVLGPPLAAFVRLLGPVIRLFNAMANALVRLTGVQPTDEVAAGFDEAEIRSMINQSRRSEEHTSELQSRQYLVCRLLLEK